MVNRVPFAMNMISKDQRVNEPRLQKNISPQYPDPSKVAILRAVYLCYTACNPSIGGCNDPYRDGNFSI